MQAIREKTPQADVSIHQKYKLCSLVKYAVIGGLLMSYSLLDYLTINTTLKTLLERNRIFKVVTQRNQYMYFIRYFAD